MRQLAIDHVEVGAAYAASTDPDPDLPRAGFRIGELGPLQRSSQLLQHHRVHGFILQPGTGTRGVR